MSKIEVVRDVREENLRRAQAMSERYGAEGVRAVGLLGSPGSGKTTLLENLLPELMLRARVAVIEGDIATDNDARRIAATGARAVQINTDGACHLDCAMVEKALGGLTLGDYDLLVIENVGNLVCPVGFPLGEDKRLAVISAAEGEDKPLKYPAAILRTDAVVITKTDIAGYVHVDAERMAAHVRGINPKARVFFAGFCGQSYQTAPADGGCGLAEFILG